MTYKSSFKFSFLSLLIFLGASCNDNEKRYREYEQELDSLATELSEQKALSDSVTDLLENNHRGSDLSVFYGRNFDSIEAPEEFISQELRKHPNLIPLEPVLGGRMQFRQVKVLTEDWVFAIYDDGHIQGNSIFQYKLQSDGSLQFKEIVSQRK